MKKRIISIFSCLLSILCVIVAIPVTASAKTSQEPLLISVSVQYESENSASGEGVNGMCYIFRLSDGRFIIYDGGWNNATMGQRVLDTLQANKVGTDIVIAAWVITHPHQDHMGVIQYFANHYTTDVTVEKIIYKFPGADYLESESLTSKVEAFTTAVAAFGAQTVTPVVGTPIIIGAAVIDILYVTPESGLAEVNASSIVSRVTLGTKKFMITADTTPTVANSLAAERNDLKSDYITVPHHGLAAAVYDNNDLENTYLYNSFYSEVDADVVLWPRSTYTDIMSTNRNLYFFDDATKPDEIITSNETRVINIVGVTCNDQWARGISTQFASGSGTEADPYIIETPNQLAYLGDSLYKAEDPEIYTGKYFRLDANIDMGGRNLAVGGETGRQMIGTPAFSSEGVAERPFKGIFDGNGYTISNIKVAGASCTGLFGVINEATIKNLNITASSSGNTDATIAGVLAGEATSSTITGCSVSTSNVKAKQYIGGIVGKAQDTIISYCTSSVAVNDTSSTEAANVVAGGILGYSPDSDGGNTIEYCVNFGDISILPAAGGILSAGGIAGYVTKGDKVNNCVNFGSVWGETSSTKRLTVAGISGRVRSNTDKNGTIIIDSCYNVMDETKTFKAISGGTAQIGLINGYINSGVLTLTNCKSISVGSAAINAGGTLATDTGNEITGIIDIAPVYTTINENKVTKPFLVGVQKSNDNTSIRFIMCIDSLEYRNVEFQIDASYTVDGVKQSAQNGYTPITNVYSSIISNGKNLTAVECGSRYFAPMTVTGIPSNIGNIEFTIRAYVKDFAGNAILVDCGTYTHTGS